jgi:hypothetical protein
LKKQQHLIGGIGKLARMLRLTERRIQQLMEGGILPREIDENGVKSSEAAIFQNA